MQEGRGQEPRPFVSARFSANRARSSIAEAVAIVASNLAEMGSSGAATVHLHIAGALGDRGDRRSVRG
jgi:hypothetical protein